MLALIFAVNTSTMDRCLFIYLFIINTVQTSIWEYISTDTHKNVDDHKRDAYVSHNTC